LRDAAVLQNDEIGPSDLTHPYDRNYFKRLTEKALLVRVGRGRVLRIAPSTGDLIGEPAARRQTEILRLLPKSGFFVSDAVEDVVGDQTAFRSSAITQNRVFRTFGEGSPLLRNARARDGLGQAAFSTQIRSKSSLALPYIWRLMSFSR
jgi:hypothetical protein